MATIGEQLITELERRGVRVVFGIPGVHTLELYRGLAGSSIRHITPRHEQGAGFMADGYARASGSPGIALVITGPGVTNTLTALAQARADSVPVLLISGVNALQGLGQGLGYLHELPDQRALTGLVTLSTERVEHAEALCPAIDRAFATGQTGRPGPRHIEIPLDVAGLPFTAVDHALSGSSPSSLRDHPEPGTAPLPQLPSAGLIGEAVTLLSAAQRPIILAGGGVRQDADAVRCLAEKLGAPVVQTINARGVMHNHALSVPASPSLEAVRCLIEDADVVLAVGTELGPTDYDMYTTGTMPRMRSLIRVDICQDQLDRREADLKLCGDAADVIHALSEAIEHGAHDGRGPNRAASTRQQAWDEIGSDMRALSTLLDAIRDTVPQAFIIGDSAQPLYAGNLYYDHDRPGGWFNAATGFGALGYAIPAAIGAAVADPDAPVICITGDGGAQFSLSELMTARDENLPVIFIIWNNQGYQEIETSMSAAGVAVIGCDPTPPDFAAIASACGIPFERRQAEAGMISRALQTARRTSGPVVIEIEAH